MELTFASGGFQGSSNQRNHEDIRFEIKYCGVCHTDLHVAADHNHVLGLQRAIISGSIIVDFTAQLMSSMPSVIISSMIMSSSSSWLLIISGCYY